MKNQMPVLLLAGLIVLAARPVSADAAEGGRKLRLFGALEYWTPNDPYKKAKDNLDRSLADNLASIAAWGDIGSGNKGSKVSAGTGARIGLISTRPGGWSFGGSVGYVTGPKGRLTMHVQDIWPAFNPTEPAMSRNVKDDYDVNFLRYMLEGNKRISIGRKTELRLCAGVGAASGKLKNEYEDRYSYHPAFAAPDDVFTSAESKKWTGLTWEVGPALAYTGDRMDLELALTYASFPKMKQDLDKGLDEFKWNPIGVRLGMSFGGKTKAAAEEGTAASEPSSVGPSRFALSIGRSGAALASSETDEDDSVTAGGFYGAFQSFIVGRLFGRVKYSATTSSEDGVDSDMKRTDLSMGVAFRNDKIFRPFIHAGVGQLNFKVSSDGESTDDSDTKAFFGVGFEAGSQRHALFLDYTYMPGVTLFDTQMNNAQFDIGYMFKWGGR